MYREILRLYQEDKKISYHYHLLLYIMIKNFVPHPFWSFCRVVAKTCKMHERHERQEIREERTNLASIQGSVVLPQYNHSRDRRCNSS